MFTKKTVRSPSFSADYVLIVGAAHIDVLADYSSADDARMDKIGHVKFSVGGTGFNIAVGVAQAGSPTKLLTVLRNNSFSSIWIRERLEAAGVAPDLLQFSDHIPESGFVAMRADGDLISAVTSTAVDAYTFPPQVIEHAVSHARIVMLDCNLPVDQMGLFLDLARRFDRPTVVAAVSDSKVSRLLELEGHQSIDIVMLNQLELNVVFDPGRSWTTEQICGGLRATNVIVTDGARGYDVLRSSGSSKHYPAPSVSDVVSHSGAGDALLAGILGYWYKHQTLDFDDAAPTIGTTIKKVLHQPGATAGSLATEVDFSLLARIAVRNESWWKRLLSPEIGVAAGLIVTILTIVILVLTYELLPEQQHTEPKVKPPSTVLSPNAKPATEGASPKIDPRRESMPSH